MSESYLYLPTGEYLKWFDDSIVSTTNIKSIENLVKYINFKITNKNIFSTKIILPAIEQHFEVVKADDTKNIVSSDRRIYKTT